MLCIWELKNMGYEFESTVLCQSGIVSMLHVCAGHVKMGFSELLLRATMWMPPPVHQEKQTS